MIAGQHLSGGCDKGVGRQRNWTHEQELLGVPGKKIYLSFDIDGGKLEINS